MFTGLIEEIGTIKSLRPEGGGFRIVVSASKITEDLQIDDSVSINGVCQTVVACNSKSFEAVAVEETLRKTTFGRLRAGDSVNLERALKVGDRLGGHFVQGHVDCVGEIRSIVKERTAVNLWISFPIEFGKYIVNTGSICVNGISLTSARVENNLFMVAVIPHTWENTTFKAAKVGDSVNLEFDIIGKYIEKLMFENKSETGKTKSSPLDKFIDQPDF
jgi:riboflavin synthase